MAKRLSLTLHDDDERALASFMAEGGQERRALLAWAAQHGMKTASESEAALLRMLIRAGASAIRENALDAGYAALAEARDEGDADRRSARRTYLERSDSVHTE